MLKPKKAFIQAELNIEKLTPIQWSGIMRAMDNYAQHYHEEHVKKMNLINNNDLLRDLRQAVADYMRSEGCSCCQDVDAHKEHAKRLAELLNVESYNDNSGYNFRKYRSH